MIKTLVISFILFVLHFAGIALHAQDVPAMMKQAEVLEKNFKEQEAINKYLQVLTYDSDNINALCKISELYNVIGKRQTAKDKQKKYYNDGLNYARKALKVNPNYAEANFAMAVSMGRIALVASGDEKIKAVKEIKSYADKCIKLDASNYKGYHVLGKWHYEVSDLSSMERWLVKVTYGALPPASIDESIKNYEKSKKLNPSFLLNYLELAKAYERKDEKQKARSLLEQLQKMSPSSADDPKIKKLGKEMLDDL